jgi:hypothetical protein
LTLSLETSNSDLDNDFVVVAGLPYQAHFVHVTGSDQTRAWGKNQTRKMIGCWNHWLDHSPLCWFCKTVSKHNPTSYAAIVKLHKIVQMLAR